MSTKISLKWSDDPSAGGSFHLYRECFDYDNEFVYLELCGVPFEASSSMDLTGTGQSSVTVRIPQQWAFKLGLVGEAGKAEDMPGLDE